VGDNVGDVAGMGADLYESYAGSILATAALGVAAATVAGWDATKTFAFLSAPMLLAALGILLSVFGIFLVRTREDASMKTLLAALNRGIYVSSVLIIVGAWFLVKFLAMPVGVFWSITIGVVLGVVIGKGTEWATAAEYAPTRFIADQAATGPATVIIGGIAEGMMSTWIPVLAVCLGTLLSFAVMDGFQDLLAGLYGVGIAAVGMLSTLGLTLATDAYGPIADNAGGNAEMSELPKEVRQRTDALDSLGNTTAAIGKGFAIGSAALTALALLASYIEEVRIGIHREAAIEYAAPAAGEAQRVASIGADYNKKWAIFLPGAPDGNREEQQFHTLSAFEGSGDLAVRVTTPDGGTVSLIINEVGEKVKDRAILAADGTSVVPRKASLKDYMTLYDASLMNPKVLVGVFIGVLAVFVFSAMTMKAVGRAAFAMVQEVRRQFKEKPGIMAGTERPDYARCVAISTAGAQREMLLPSILAIALPVVTGLVLNVAGVLGLLVGGLCAGFSVAVFMANSGGAWDNAKKYIEAGHLGGKGSMAHKAAVVGDTVGDPFKDTCGPSLNILIKLMTMVSIVFAGLIVKYAPAIGHWLNLGN
jgi:inorganic pyrophosphatase/K(+)-stimulated pyrophosphate-energized sodium pump